MRARRHRRLGLEQLEQRQVMAANLYLDFGAAFEFDNASGRHVFEDFAQVYGNSNGIFQASHHNYDNAWSDSAQGLTSRQAEFALEVQQLIPGQLEGSLLNTLVEIGIDYDESGWIDPADAEALSQDVANLVRRIYQPFDVNVQIVASSNPQQVEQWLDASDTSDAYIFVAGKARREPTGSGRPMNLGVAWIDNGNLWDNVGFAAADDLARRVPREFVPTDPEGPGDWRLDYLATRLANTAAHEAGHTFGLHHIDIFNRTSDDGDIMDVGSDARTTELVLATRGFAFNVSETDYQVSQESYQVLADALGLKPDAPAYVTGTGGHDEIEIVGITGTKRAEVTVRSFNDFNQLNFDGEISYEIDASNGIIVEAGRGNDTVTVTGIKGPVELRGGPGNDELHASEGRDRLQGDEGDDLLMGGQNNDTYVFGGPRLWRLGRDTIRDAGGTDTLDFSTYQRAIEIDLALMSWQAVDRPRTSDGLPVEPHPDWDYEPESHLWVLLDNGFLKPGIENVIGTEYSDAIFGNASANVLEGRGGDDTINGRQGSDKLDGGAGNDSLDGGDDTDRDELTGGPGWDTFILHYDQDSRGAWVQLDRYFAELGKGDEIVADYRRSSSR